ncbi:NACHT, LRR and PYD domains-containing protein 12-like isoform X1 [Pocillopora verrucosa]|uniref:NACHT, LRR and PYD domains-containing protein 12-like isoform X1 n=1 Tax=Pocillopora verrucosa TaxID=203993 RepID=UPI00333E7016
MEKILEYLEPKTFHRVHYVAVCFWILISVIFFAVFLDMESNESRLDFRCDGAKSETVDTVRGKCYEKYMKQYNKFGFPVYGFVILNLLLIAFVCAIYSQIVRPKVDHLLDQDTASSTGNKLFIAYCSQLSIRIVLGVIFIILQTQLLYPLNFSSQFNCYLTDGTTQPSNSSDNAQNSTLLDCHNQRAVKKTFWMYAVLAVNGTIVAGTLVETVYLFSRACIERSFMEDSKFLKTHLSLNQHLNGTNETMPLTERDTEELQEQEFQKFIESTKKIIARGTKKLLELQSPFVGNPSDHSTAKNLTLDQIYTNLVVIQDRETHDFTENREEQLKVYPRSRDGNSQPKSLEDLLDVESKKVLIVGRPGIGKTLCCIKLLRDWALNKDFKATSGAQVHFNAAFFVKFRRFDSDKNLSLKDLLIQSEYFPTGYMDDKVWNHLQKNPKGVLMLFDGFDEFEHDEKKTKASPYPKGIEDEKPLQILYQWLVTGQLLQDASIVTTTRPTALSGIAHLKFDKSFEILGFSTEQIKEYIDKFAGDDKQAGETLWRHISSNMNLLSLCYVPVNSFIMCSSLSEIMRFESSDSVTLPSKLTTIYKIAVKVFYFKHTKEFRDKHFTRENYLSDNLPLAVEEKFKKLGRVAFEGIQEGKLILGGIKVQGMEGSALFHRLPDRRAALKDEKQFCFIHLTMQEFFAARHLASDLSETELRNFVSENIKNGKWQLVFQFLAGLMEDKVHLPIEIITALLPVKTEERESARYNEQWTENEEQRKVKCWPTKDERDLAVTLIKCINENSRMKLEAQRKLRQMNFNCVNFIRSHLTAVDCSSLVNVINVQQISHLDLSYNNIGPLGCFEICKLLKCRESQLSWLNLTKNQLTDEAAKYLAEAINNKNCQLHMLNLTENNISDIGAQHLAEAINNNCQLHTLDLTANNISHIGAQHLAEAINNNNCQLHTLDLTYNKISDTGAQYFAEAIKNNNCQLHTLNLSYNNISNIGSQHLAKAINNNNCQLHTLDLTANNISHVGAQHLAEAINNNNCQLRTLNLSYNNISNIGAQYLAEAINNNNCQLHTLNLTQNNISDIGALHLAEAINNNNCQLHTLNLSNNINMTEAGDQKARNLLSNSQSKCDLIL